MGVIVNAIRNTGQLQKSILTDQTAVNINKVINHLDANLLQTSTCTLVPSIICSYVLNKS